MKINNITQGSQELNKTSRKKESGQAGGFHKLLTQQLAACKNIGATSDVVMAAQPTADPKLRIVGLSVTESTISNLEAFGNALADKRFAVDQLEPFVSALEEETLALLDIKKQLPEGDPLAQLLEKVAAVSYVEANKYRRGDYNA
jgi:hypothetical protein